MKQDKVQRVQELRRSSATSRYSSSKELTEQALISEYLNEDPNEQLENEESS